MTESRHFPYLKIVKASAGSGKTYYLTKTFVEFLLSDSIKYNDLKNIIALTFSNNATIEIKEKILDWLKDIYFGKEKTINEFQHLGFKKEELQKKAESIIDKILNSYSEFQVRTIDSFLTKIFKAEAIKFGYPGDFNILMNNENFLHRAFEIFLAKFSEKSGLMESLIKLIEIIEDTLTADSTYPWNPSQKIFRELKNLYLITSKSSEKLNGEITKKFLQYLADAEKIKKNLKAIAKKFKEVVYKYGKSFKSNSSIEKLLYAIQNENYNKILDFSINKIPVVNPNDEIEVLWKEFKKAVAKYLDLYAKTYFIPYILVFLGFEETLWNLKLKEQKVFIEDINSLIREKLEYFFIPEIYIKLGARIYHYLIDEFQDTSPVQWQNLRILIENSLSEGGSLLVVGDTKQAIYGFRGADYSIMTELIEEAENPQQFPSLDKYKINNLYYNYRSGRRIIDFVKDYFKSELKEYLKNESEKKHIFCQHEIPLPLTLSGLYDCHQKVREDLNDIGFVKIERIEYDDEEKEERQKKALINLIEKLRNEHGFSSKNIAILAFKNSTLKQLSTWLNEEEIDFISYSSLDIRNRKVISELMFLLRFIDSPIDNFSFSLFLLGEIAGKNFKSFYENWETTLENFLSLCNKNRKTDKNPYYVKFREKFPELWENFFAELLRKTGFLPLYDLVSEIYNRFNLFETFPEEEGALIKFLEILLTFEGNGGGLKKFIEFYTTSGEEDETFWDTSKPFGKDAITLMTVHKAKGLEFPAVLIWTDMDSIKIEKITYKNGEFLKLLSEKTLKNPYLEELKKIREKALNRSFTEELNKLYVALTRAKEVLYIAIPCKKPKEGNGKNCPYRNDAVKCLFQMETFQQEENYLAKLIEEEMHENSFLEIKHSTLNSEQSLRTYHYREDLADTEETKKGELLHKIISEIIYADLDEEENLKEHIKEKIKKLTFELKTSFDTLDLLEIVMDILKNQELKEFFVPAKNREIFTEKEIVDEIGNLFRVDRIVVEPECFRVLEFKFGNFPYEQKAIEQTKKYMELLSKIYPDKKSVGLIYFSEKKSLRKL